MQENTETQTEQTNPEQAPEVQKSPAEQAQDAVKISRKLREGYNMLLEREIWTYINALTASGVNENQKYQLKKSMARAISFGVNFMGGDPDIQLLQKGRLAQIENNLAMAIVKVSECNTLIMADNMRIQDEANEAVKLKAEGRSEEGVKPIDQLLAEQGEELLKQETKTETKENTNV